MEDTGSSYHTLAMPTVFTDQSEGKAETDPT